MISFLAMLAMIGVFIAGNVYAAHTVAGLVMVGVFAVVVGLLFALAETHGFEGTTVLANAAPLTWEKLWGRVIRFGLDRNRMVGPELLYVQTPQGPKPLVSVFTARINHEPSIVFDTADDAAHAEVFNALKQGVM